MAAVVETALPSNTAEQIGGEEVQENRDKLGDLVDKMDNAKISENGVVDTEKIIKHPLQNAWTLWFFKNDKSRTWEENQRPIITVTTVEDFWSLYNHIEVASRLCPKTTQTTDCRDVYCGHRIRCLDGSTPPTPPGKCCPDRKLCKNPFSIFFRNWGGFMINSIQRNKM